MERVVGAQEMALLLNVNRQRVYQLSQKAGFPKPMASLAMGKVWWLHDLESWAASKGRVLNVEALTTDVQADDDSTP